jgi:hypothetical protein
MRPRAMTVCHMIAAPGQASQVPGGPSPGRTDLYAASDTASSGFKTRHPHLDPGLPKYKHHNDRHEPTLIAAASPR